MKKKVEYLKPCNHLVLDLKRFSVTLNVLEDGKFSNPFIEYDNRLEIEQKKEENAIKITMDGQYILKKGAPYGLDKNERSIQFYVSKENLKNLTIDCNVFNVKDVSFYHPFDLKANRVEIENCNLEKTNIKVNEQVKIKNAKLNSISLGYWCRSVKISNAKIDWLLQKQESSCDFYIDNTTIQYINLKEVQLLKAYKSHIHTCLLQHINTSVIDQAVFEKSTIKNIKVFKGNIKYDHCDFETGFTEVIKGNLEIANDKYKVKRGIFGTYIKEDKELPHYFNVKKGKIKML